MQVEQDHIEGAKLRQLAEDVPLEACVGRGLNWPARNGVGCGAANRFQSALTRQPNECRIARVDRRVDLARFRQSQITSRVANHIGSRHGAGAKVRQ